MRTPEPTKNLRVWYKRASTWTTAIIIFAGPKIVRLIDAAGRHICIGRPAWGFTFDVRGFENA